MVAPKDQDTKQRIGFFDLLIIVLSIYVLGSLIAETFFALPRETSRVISILDNVICGFFLVDFIIRFYRAESKLQFMKWGWIDLISSIPAFEGGRTLRLIRIIRILRAFRSLTHIVNFIFKNRMHGTFTTVCLLSVLLIIFSSIAILQVEVDPNSNIKTAEDALWWSYVTITTVGYGDKFPVTTAGRIIAAVLMTAGVGLFGTFTGLVSSWFVEDKAQREKAAAEKESS
jgi:voltage-gated potassium channel